MSSAWPQSCAPPTSAGWRVSRVTLRGDRLNTTYPSTRGGLFSWARNRYARINLALEVPVGTNLRVDDSAGHIYVNDLGDVNLDDGSGNMFVRDVGSLTVEDRSGHINITRVAGNVRLDDSSGSLKLEGVTGNVVIDDGSGSLIISDVTGNVTVRDRIGQHQDRSGWRTRPPGRDRLGGRDGPQCGGGPGGTGRAPRPNPVFGHPWEAGSAAGEAGGAVEVA